MRLIVDANVLVGEVLRQRGRQLLHDSWIELFIPERTLNETEHELRKRVRALVRYRKLEGESAEIYFDFMSTIYQRVAAMPASGYAEHEKSARRCIPRDPDDWHAVALALALSADIWTHDADFLGCGVATWTTDTLLAYLEHDAPT